MLNVRFCLALSLVFAISGCGGSDSSGGSGGPVATATPTPTPTPTSTASPLPSVSPTPTATPDPLTVLNCGDSDGGISNNNLDADAKAYLLCKHNESRSEVALGVFAGSNGNLPAASDMKRLQWDSKLEQVAQNYANQCIWQHNPNRQSQYNALSPTDINGDPIAGNETVGENLAFFASSILTSATMEFAVNGYDAWIDEGDFYSYGALNVSDFCGTTTCGHFTQAIWADSYKVGCAVNFCAAGTVSSLPATYLVCNYASTGNYVGLEPYDSTASASDVCTTASAGQTVCRNGLTESDSYQTGL